MKKGAIRSGFDESSPFTRHYPTPQKRAKTAKATVVGISNDDMVEDFDFEKLARSNEVTSDFDVGLGWSRLTSRMIVLCGAPSYDAKINHPSVRQTRLRATTAGFFSYRRSRLGWSEQWWQRYRIKRAANYLLRDSCHPAIQSRLNVGAD